MKIKEQLLRNGINISTPVDKYLITLTHKDIFLIIVTCENEYIEHHYSCDYYRAMKRFKSQVQKYEKLIKSSD